VDNKLPLLQSILDDAPVPELDTLYPFHSLCSPGMPLPGPNFCRAAAAMGSAPELAGKGKKTALVDPGKHLHYLYRRALYDRRFTLPVQYKGAWLHASYLAGHPLNAAGGVERCDEDTENAFGPRPAEVMVVGKHPGREELQQLRNFVGPASEDLYKAFGDLGLTERDYGDWYVTNAMRFQHLDANAGSIPTDWLKDCAPLLHQELRIVQPKYLLCFGAEAIKAVLGPGYAVGTLAGRVVPITYAISGPGELPIRTHTVKVMGMLHPAAVFHRPEMYDEFVMQLGMFWQLINGADLGAAEAGIDHQDIYKERQLVQLVDEMLADTSPDADVIAVDAEWHGDPGEPGSYLRTIQISNKDKWARCIVLRWAGGAPAFKPGIDVAIRELRRLFNPPGRPLPRVGGHFFRADLPMMLMTEGLDLRPHYEIDPVDPRKGGWDTGLMYHAVNEATRYKLEDVGMRLTTAPRYDAKLQEWKKAYCAAHHLKDDDLDGYGECPAEILHPYANYDVDITRRIRMKLAEPGGLLDSDAYGNNCWAAYHLHHRASPAFLEMERSGFYVDRNRVDDLTREFMETSDRLLNELRNDLNWHEVRDERGRVLHPAFNPKSNIQCVAALFGDDYARKRDKNTGEFLRIRPPDAITLGLTPITSTGKRPKLWSKLIERREELFHTPSTNKEVLGILGHHNPIARKLRDFKFIAQVLQSTLRRPTVNDETHEYVTNEDGNFEYEKGIPGLASSDGFIRTHLAQVLETARAASRRPNLTNLSKRREDDYKRIIGKDVHKHPVRSMLMSAPGFVDIETDLVGAELAVLAWLSQSPAMIEHVRRSMLPESHPDHYDIHSRQAVKAFNLTDVEPTKSGMKKAGVPGLRVAAKNVNFGIPYGRSAEAISRQCAEEGVDVDEVGCQMMIDAYFQQYPETEGFLAECQARSQDPRWLRGAYGSYRRFVATNDRGVIGEQHRQAQNFPIQNGVADAVSLAMANLMEYRKTLNPEECWFWMVLQIHDALIVRCRPEHAHRVYHEIIPKCMVEDVPFWPHRLDGTPIPVAEPYRFGIDREVYIHWGEAITEQEAELYKLPEWMLKH